MRGVRSQFKFLTTTRSIFFSLKKSEITILRNFQLHENEKESAICVH